MYNSLAQQLVGYDITGSILEFDRDGDILSGGDKLREVYIMSFPRLLAKDEIKKGSFVFQYCTGGLNTAPTWVERKTISDYGANTNYRVNSPCGEYGILYTSSLAVDGTGVGLLFYQARIAVLTASLMNLATGGAGKPLTGTNDADSLLTGSEITCSCDGFRNRWYDLDFVNTTELNSQVHFIRISHNEFNYSSNPTYLSGSKIRVKNVSTDQPISYISKVGLHAADGATLAVASLSEMLKNSSDQEFVIRVRLDY
jgi:hypothetical protein